MRVGGLEPVGGGEKAQQGSGAAGKVWAAAAAAAALVLVGGYLWWAQANPEITDEVPMRPLHEAELSGHLKRVSVDPGRFKQLLAESDAVGDFADEHAGAQAAYDAIRARAKALSFVPWSMGEPRVGKVQLPAEVLKTLKADKGRAELYPLELAALLVATVRAQGGTALVAELADLEGESAPLDGTGYLGYFVAAVYDNEEATGTPRVYDPFGGRKLEAGSASITPMDDLAAIGAALSLKGVRQVHARFDTQAAIQTTEQAIRLGPRLPCVRTARGVVLLAAELADDAQAELRAAHQLRSDAARLHLLANASLIGGDLAGANTHLSRALERSPDYANARVSLALLQLMEGKADEARAELERAERLAPDLSLVRSAWAQYHAAKGAFEQAVHHAQQALARRPSVEVRLQLARLHHHMGNYDAMREQAQAILKETPGYRHERLRAALERVLGPTVFVDEDDTEDDSAEPGAESTKGLRAPDLGKLQLDAPSGLLGDSDEPAGEKMPAGESAEPLLLLGDPSKLRLRDGDQDLKLDLSN